MQQVAINIDQCGTVFPLLNQMRVPQFVVEGLCHALVVPVVTERCLPRASQLGAPYTPRKGAEYSTEDKAATAAVCERQSNSRAMRQTPASVYPLISFEVCRNGVSTHICDMPALLYPIVELKAPSVG